jgi:hypothetical protein
MLAHLAGAAGGGAGVAGVGVAGAAFSTAGAVAVGEFAVVDAVVDGSVLEFPPNSDMANPATRITTTMPAHSGQRDDVL